MTESAFFQDLALLMTVSGLVAIVFSRLGWPKALGYILVGIVLNGHTFGGSLLVDEGSTRTIGQIGVVFLMFTMGLSFSPREMRKIRDVALPTAIFDTVVMIWLGYVLGTRVFGWPAAQSVFLGVAICDSATTLLAKVLGELGWTGRPFARYVLGTSVCEDIVCVGAIAVATGFARTGEMSAADFLMSLFWLATFFLTVLVFGFVLVPRLLKSVSRRRDDEALLLTLLGCCFFVSYFAQKFEFSLALGAFLVGVIGGSSDVRDRLGRLTDPLKSMFSAVFFVSIGLLVNPTDLVRHLPEILLVSAVVVVGKGANVLVGSLATGVGVKTAVQNAFGLAQIGEFAFLVAVLYAGLSPDRNANAMFPIAVGVSLLTTLLNPWMIRVSDRVGDFAERRLSERVKNSLAAYRAWLGKLRASNDSPAAASLRSAAIRLGVYGTLLFSVSVSLAMLPRCDFSRLSGFVESYDRQLAFGLTNLFFLFQLPLVLSSARTLGEAVASLLVGEGSDRWRAPVQNLVRSAVVSVVLVAYAVELLMLDSAVVPADGVTSVVFVLVMAVVAVAGWRFFVKASRRAVSRLEEALTAEERRESLRQMTAIEEVPERRLTLDAASCAVGRTVAELGVRARTGCSIAAVERGGRTFRNIGPGWQFGAGDTLVVFGTPAQVAALVELLGGVP